MRHTFFDSPIVSGPLRALSKFIFKIRGWELQGTPPTLDKYVVIAAPHTSNWDFPVMVAVALISGLKLFWMGKNTLFRGPAGPIMRWMGGIPVNRSASTNMVDQMVEAFNNQTELALVIAPEGTRGKSAQWKSGFYHIAEGANVPVLMAFIDFEKKITGFGPFFTPSGDKEKDMAEIKSYYSQYRGKHPDLFHHPDE